MYRRVHPHAHGNGYSEVVSGAESKRAMHTMEILVSQKAYLTDLFVLLLTVCLFGAYFPLLLD